MLKYRVVYIEGVTRKVVEVECNSFNDINFALSSKSVWVSSVVILSIVLINTEPEKIN